MNQNYVQYHQAVLIPQQLFFERQVVGFTEHPYLFWLFLSLIPINLSVVLFAQTGNRVFISTAMPSSFGISLLPLAIKIGAILMEQWGRGLKYFIVCPEQEIESWFKNQMSFLMGNSSMVYSGVVLAVVGSVLYYLSGIFDDLKPIQCVALALIIILNALISGIAWFNLFGFARVIWRLGQFPLKVEGGSEGILSTGYTLMKCYGIAITLNYTFSLINSIGMQSAKLLIMLEAPYIVFFVITFIVCQIPVHNKMVEYKKLKISEINERLIFLKQQNPSVLMEIKLLEEQMQTLERNRTDIIALPEWPTAWKALLGK